MCFIVHKRLHTFDGLDDLGENENRVSSAERRTTWEDNADSSSVGTKSVSEKTQFEAGHAELKRQLTTSFMYRKKHEGDII